MTLLNQYRKFVIKHIFSGQSLFKMKFNTFYLFFAFLIITPGCNPSQGGSSSNLTRDEFINDLKHRTFNYFWELVDKPTWQTPDRYPQKAFTSIAATGFGLASYITGIENNYITRKEGAVRVHNTLEWLWNSQQGPQAAGTSGYKGFYYHFLNYGTGTRYEQVELSTIDTGLLMAGILACQSYFDKDDGLEKNIRALADSLYLRVEWDWAMNGRKNMSMGWHPEKGFIPAEWTGYNEAMILVIMALGSPSHPIHDSAWNSWCKTYEWADFYGYEHVNFTPLFGHQFSHMFIDFRGIQDDYMRRKGIDYFENSVRGTLSNRAYCMDNPSGFTGYGPDIWGLTACDGPGSKRLITNEGTMQFWTYRARGASMEGIVDDGTIAPAAAGGSVPFTPETSIDALLAMKNEFGDSLYQEFGFKDAFNLTYQAENKTEPGWFDQDYIGIDQGTIIIQLENYHTGLIWNMMKKNKYIVAGLKNAGFAGGWLEEWNDGMIE